MKRPRNEKRPSLVSGNNPVKGPLLEKQNNSKIIISHLKKNKKYHSNRVSLRPNTRNVHCKFYCITVYFDGAKHGIYIIDNFIRNSLYKYIPYYLSIQMPFGYQTVIWMVRLIVWLICPITWLLTCMGSDSYTEH